jgi:hypothetical protein
MKCLGFDSVATATLSLATSGRCHQRLLGIEAERRYDGGAADSIIQMKLSNDKWRVVAKFLQVIGVVCCIAFFVSHFALLAYYSGHRPRVPEPEHGWTVGLTWTHPVSYGSERDERRSQWLFGLFLPSFGLIALGEMIKIYKLDDYSGLRTRLKLPWDHKWGP